MHTVQNIYWRNTQAKPRLQMTQHSRFVHFLSCYLRPGTPHRLSSWGSVCQLICLPQLSLKYHKVEAELAIFRPVCKKLFLTSCSSAVIPLICISNQWALCDCRWKGRFHSYWFMPLMQSGRCKSTAAESREGWLTGCWPLCLVAKPPANNLNLVGGNWISRKWSVHAGALRCAECHFSKVEGSASALCHFAAY